ncbi:hypothetical protein ACLE20_14345 [Rhizobium sp. YIM 134829]|uniref:hypothetical protein n=1 Tax=Rhizobium sp. YIM 134829 TaxID=3390453 RepID=UPI00397A1648
MTADLSPQTVAAAKWLAAQEEPPARVVPTIRERFHLNAIEACDACALARHYRQHGRRDDA